MPPTLIIHGEADKLVPIYQAEIFLKAMRAGRRESPVKLIAKPGLDHGWPGIEKGCGAVRRLFDVHLRGLKP